MCIGFFKSRFGFFISLKLILFVTILPSHTNILINEFLTATDTTDANNTPLEWIEVYNAGPDTIDLNGYTLTDDPLAPAKWHLPSIILSPGTYLLIWATGYDLLGPTEYHTNFRLRKAGEYLALNRPDGSPADSITYPPQRRDISYGRQPDGNREWGYFPDPTPKSSNTTEWAYGFSAPPYVSSPAGVYSEPISITLTATESDTIIRFTTDGSIPDESSELYRKPISVTQTMPLRVRTFRDEYFPGDVITYTYIIRERIVLPILSLVTEPPNLWDRRTGIYENSQQHGREWERPVSVEYFNRQGTREFAENAGIRIHGGASRTRSPKRSFRLYFRSEYGPTMLEYPLFPSTSVNSFDQLVLRAGFNDTWGYDREMQRDTAIYVSDQVVRNLFLDMGQVASHGIFTELYLNGEYWGLYNPCERIHEDFLQSHYSSEMWDVIVDEEIHDGDGETWNEFKRWVARNDLSQPAAYQAVQQKVDLENFTDYIILNVWVQNYDWPHHNWYAARERHPFGSWKFFLWDVEYSFGSGIHGYQVNQNTFNNATDSGKGLIGLLFGKLIHNPEYRTYFWLQLQHHLAVSLEEEHVLKRLEEQLDIVRPAIPAEAEKWGEGKTLSDWERAAQLARDFVKERTPIVVDFINREIGPPPVAVERWQLY